MNKSDLIRIVSDHLGIPKEKVEKVLDTTIQVIEVSLACGENVTIHRFGRFEPRTKKAVTRILPITGDKIEVPEKKSVLFHSSTHLKDRINNK